MSASGAPPSEPPAPAASADHGRRRALKAMAGVGAGALVWTEPTIRGLARRPAYADSASVEGSQAFTTDQLAGTPVGAVTFQTGDATFVLTNNGNGTSTLSATLDGCPCTIDSFTPAALGVELTLSDGGLAEFVGSLGGGVVVFNGELGAPSAGLLTGGVLSGSCLL